MARCTIILVICALVLPAACGKDAPERSDEEQIRAVLTAFEEAVEAGKPKAAFEHVSHDFRNRRGATRGQMLLMLTQQLRRRGKTHVLSRVVSIEIAEEEGFEARVKLVAAAAARPIDSAVTASRLSARVFHFDLVMTLEDKGEWRISGAEWRNADVGDLFDGS